jgi:hypothetical protein
MQCFCVAKNSESQVNAFWKYVLKSVHERIRNFARMTITLILSVIQQAPIIRTNHYAIDPSAQCLFLIEGVYCIC